MEKVDWFCKCCTGYYGRENPTIINDHINEVCYKATSMCTLCYRQSNGVPFGEGVKQINKQIAKSEES